MLSQAFFYNVGCVFSEFFLSVFIESVTFRLNRLIINSFAMVTLFLKVSLF